MTRLLVEGWRGVNHSYALVNQCQLLELLKDDSLQVFHRDLPYAMAHWTPTALDAGFSPQDSARIAALQEPPPGEAVDCTLRITSPFRAPPPGSGRTLSWMATELGLHGRSFEPGAEHSPAFTEGGNQIITCSRWSRDRLVDHGLDAQRIRVMSLAVNSNTFFPLSAAERQTNRANLGLGSEHVVFLNLGAAMWNKGLDLLLLAFATVRQRHEHARLIIKDQRGLYGVSVEPMLQDLAARNPGLFTPQVLASIQVVPVNLNQAQLRLLYGLAECYVSPYRAEGFNLPVLEAVACGTPVVVTAGGATDDFIDASVGVRVASVPHSQDGNEPGEVRRWCEPDMPALVAAMERFAAGTGIDREAFVAGRQRLIERLSWPAVVRELRALI